MQKLILILVGIIFLLSNACTPKLKSTSSPAPLNDTLLIAQNQSVQLLDGALKISLQSVLESRCPFNSACIRAGEAKANLEITTDQKAVLQLEVKGLCYERDGSCGEQKTLSNYRFQLLNIDPYPGKGNTAGAEKIARLVVQKIDQQ